MHKVTREGDEQACSCGLRWGVDEADPHAQTPEEHLESIKYQLGDK